VDTRTKIASPQEAAEAARRARTEGKRVKVVTGHFDPLLAAHARRIAELRDPGAALWVVITEPTRPILAAQARAVMVAALAGVDGVVACLGRPAAEVLGPLEPYEIYADEADDERRTRDLMLHVQNRHS
jgi:bifunctional ADP-heptose synthase (sugar kinase/adenylyltransferase)